MLKVELPGEFNLTWSVDGDCDRSSAQHAEIGVSWVCTDVSELWVVQKVSYIHAKLEAEGFREDEILSQPRNNRVGRWLADIAKGLWIKSVANGEIVVDSILRGVVGSGHIVVTRH